MYGFQHPPQQHSQQHSQQHEPHHDVFAIQHLSRRVEMLEQMFALQQQTNEALLRAMKGDTVSSHQRQPSHASPHKDVVDDDVHVVVVDDPSSVMLMARGGGTTNADGLSATVVGPRRAAA